MISTGLIAILAALGITSGAGSGWFFSRRSRRKLAQAQAGWIEKTEGIIEDELNALGLLVQETVQQQVNLAMSEVLAAMAEAERQKIAYAQARAQAEELDRLRSAAAANKSQPGFGQGLPIAQSIAEMNERMAGLQERMRRAGMPIPGDQ